MRCRTRSPANCPDPGVSRRFRCPGMLPQCYPAPTGLFFQVPETAVFQRFRTSRKQRPRVTLGLFWPAKRGDDPDSNKRAMRRDGVRECPKTRAVEDIRTSSIRRSRRRIPLPFYSLCVRIHLYALCMHPQLHTFSCPQPYEHAYSRFCMHCMQSFSELCSRIACIVGFLVHTMHTSYDPYDFSDGMGGRPVEKRMDGTSERSRRSNLQGRLVGWVEFDCFT